jgi:hypothetical protein
MWWGEESMKSPQSFLAKSSLPILCMEGEAGAFLQDAHYSTSALAGYSAGLSAASVLATREDSIAVAPLSTIQCPLLQRHNAVFHSVDAAS